MKRLAQQQIRSGTYRGALTLPDLNHIKRQTQHVKAVMSSPVSRSKSKSRSKQTVNQLIETIKNPHVRTARRAYGIMLAQSEADILKKPKTRQNSNSRSVENRWDPYGDTDLNSRQRNSVL